MYQRDNNKNHKMILGIKQKKPQQPTNQYLYYSPKSIVAFLKNFTGILKEEKGELRCGQSRC